MTQKYLADFSLALMNRTGAYHISKEIVDSCCDNFEAVRYWRLFWPGAAETTLIRKLLTRAMMFEISRLEASDRYPWPQPARCRNLPTVFFDPLYVLRAPLTSQDIVLCHDVGPLSHRNLFDPRTSALYETAYAKIKAAAPGVVFVSNASRDAFIELFGSDFRFLHTIRLFTRPQAVDGAETPPDLPLTDFTLSVGALETRKNYPRIIEAFDRSGLGRQGYAHVICGPRGHGHDEIADAAANVEGVHILGQVDDPTLRWLYRHAKGFVLPSLLEGFGVPAIEASYAGLVPIVSANTAQAEAIGNHGICVDPLNVNEIADGFRRLAAMPDEERSQLSQAAAQFAREWTADDFRSAWRALLDRNAPPIA